MKEQAPLMAFSRFFEKAIKLIKPPYMRFLVVLTTALLFFLYFFKEKIDATIATVLLVIVIISFAFFALLSEYLQNKYLYSARTEAELKNALRDMVLKYQLVQRSGQQNNNGKTD